MKTLFLYITVFVLASLAGTELYVQHTEIVGLQNAVRSQDKRLSDFKQSQTVFDNGINRNEKTLNRNQAQLYDAVKSILMFLKNATEPEPKDSKDRL